MDKVYVYDSDNNALEMEVVSIFKFDNNNFNYVIYTDHENYYAAKYINDIGELNTDLSDRELSICNAIMEGVSG